MLGVRADRCSRGLVWMVSQWFELWVEFTNLRTEMESRVGHVASSIDQSVIYCRIEEILRAQLRCQ